MQRRESRPIRISRKDSPATQLPTFRRRAIEIGPQKNQIARDKGAIAVGMIRTGRRRKAIKVCVARAICVDLEDSPVMERAAARRCAVQSTVSKHQSARRILAIRDIEIVGIGKPGPIRAQREQSAPSEDSAATSRAVQFTSDESQTRA